MFFERRKRAAQPIRLIGGEIGPHNGDLHRLFLKQWHAQRFAQHRAQRVRRKADLLLSVPSPDIGMHHIALNGAGADNRNLDHQIIEITWPHAGQEIHLRTRFHLKHAHAVGLAQHIVNTRIFRRQRGEGIVALVVHFQQIERLADTGQHAQRKHIDLEDAKAVDIVLVPADDGAIFHRGVFDGHQLVQSPFGDDKTADMLRQMAGKAVDLIDQRNSLLQPRVAEIEADFGHALGLQPLGGKEAPELGTQRRYRILRQTHGASHFADGAFAPVMHDRRTQARAVTAIGFVYMLDHFLAPFMFEIDIDVGRFVPCLADKAFEHHRAHFRTDRGDAKAITHHRIGCRPAPLT